MTGIFAFVACDLFILTAFMSSVPVVANTMLSCASVSLVLLLLYTYCQPNSMQHVSATVFGTGSLRRSISFYIYLMSLLYDDLSVLYVKITT